MMKTRWHRGNGGDHHSPVEMRFIDMFMTALGSLVFIALLLVFLLPKTSQHGEQAIKNMIKELVSENRELKRQVAGQVPGIPGGGGKTEDINIMRRWFSVVLITTGCRQGEPEMYARLEGKLANVNTNAPEPQAVDFDASNPSKKSTFFGSGYFDIDDVGSDRVLADLLGEIPSTAVINGGVHEKLFYGGARAGGAWWSVYVGLNDPRAQGKVDCKITPVYLSSDGSMSGDQIALNEREPFAWLRHFEVNVDGTTTLGTSPSTDDEFKRLLAEFSIKQSRILFEKKGLCNTVDAYYALLVPKPPTPQNPDTALPTGASVWNYGKSTVYLVSDGSGRRFYFDSPACEEAVAGAKHGMLLFDGKYVAVGSEKRYDGVAFSYSKGCEVGKYPVSGDVSDDYQHVTLRGKAPVLDSDCKLTGTHDEVLMLDLRPSSGSDREHRNFRECGTCPEMLIVPSGSFLMGSSDTDPVRGMDESPRHTVTIAYPFAIGEFPVTFDEWDACVADGGCNGYQPSDNGWGRGRRPVINVSWDDAEAYVKWLSHKTGKAYRLPTEAEREYSARAGTTTPFWWGGKISPKNANYDATHSVPVDDFPANPWGAYQVSGNIYEWTEDCYHDSYDGAPTDGSAWKGSNCHGHIARGGSWDSNPYELRSAYRGLFPSDKRTVRVGFRVARTVTAEDCGTRVAPVPTICTLSRKLIPYGQPQSAK